MPPTPNAAPTDSTSTPPPTSSGEKARPAKPLLVRRLRTAPINPLNPKLALRGETDAERFTPPAKTHASDAGLDLVSTTHVLVHPGTEARIAHNLSIALPPNTIGLIMPRSSTLQRKGLIVIPGVLDPGFRGEVQTVVYNAKHAHRVQVQSGERLSQLLILPLIPVEVSVVDALPESDRGEAGFGSSGGFGGPVDGPAK